MSELCEYDKLNESLAYIKSQVHVVPKVGIICGSGLGGLVNLIQAPVSIPYANIPHFPKSTVVGHSGELVFGFQKDVPVVCMLGRVHLYEGYTSTECVRPVRLMAMLGISVLCVTNAAGNLNKSFTPGDFMIIKDHISFPALSGENPLRGPHDSRFGERFVNMSDAYNVGLSADFEKASQELGLADRVRKGVYAMCIGPTYETIAEARMLRLIGADACGMSTAPEIVAAHQMGVKCLGVSLLTNNVISDYDDKDIVAHDEVVEMGKRRSEDFIKLILAVIESAKKRLVL